MSYKIYKEVQIDKETKFNSRTHGTLDLKEVVSKIKEYIDEEPEYGYNLIIGTDSQNHYHTKMVLVICVCREGKGGIFFFRPMYFERIRELTKKIYTETEISIRCAKEMMDIMIEEELYMNATIHVDVGKRGKTRELITGVTGWVIAEGFNCEIKPEAYVASAIANKITK